MFSSSVWAIHALLRIRSPLQQSAPRATFAWNTNGLRRALTRATALFLGGFFIGLVFVSHLWTIVTQRAPRLPSVPSTHATPSEEASSCIFIDIPFLFAIIVSSPAWLSLVRRVVTPEASTANQSRWWPLSRVVFIFGAIAGFYGFFPLAVRFLFELHPHDSRANVQAFMALLWNAVFGTALVLSTLPMSFWAFRPRLGETCLTGRIPFLTPLVMMAAATATRTHDLPNLILLFVPMCAALGVGIAAAEVDFAKSGGTRSAPGCGHGLLGSRAKRPSAPEWRWRFGASQVRPDPRGRG